MTRKKNPNCPSCKSETTQKKGTRVSGNGTVRQTYRCTSCGKWYSKVRRGSHNPKVVHKANYDTAKSYIANVEPIISTSKTWVITSCINNTKTNTKFLDTLRGYCNHNNAELLVIPLVHYKKEISGDIKWDDELSPYLFSSNIRLTYNLNVLGKMKVNPISDPLAGVDHLTKGISTIIGSPQMMMKTIANSHIDKPAIAYSTGSVSSAEYSDTKAGTKADFNHSYSALVIEEDPAIESFHIRVLNSSEDGSFYDIGHYYSGNIKTTSERIQALILGDEHVTHIDSTVKAATFTNNDSIVNHLLPMYIVRHDLLDFESRSHHSEKASSNYKKHITNSDNVLDELNNTLSYLIETTPPFSKSIIVDSNHNSHLDQWLDRAGPVIQYDPKNMEIYHKLWTLKINAMNNGIEGSAFELWCKTTSVLKNIIFLQEASSFKISDIELAYHSNHGINGSRGSAAQFAKLGCKTVIGHSHSPQIIHGCYNVGHSCVSKMSYNKGPSSWEQAHCIINPDGKRQMIFINQGKWRR